MASVVGKDVPFALLQAIAELPEDALRRALDRMQAAEFVYETGLFPDLAYSFKHALTHEVAYGGLLQERRRELHARIVETMERCYSDRLAEQVDRLAHHAVRGAVWDKALAYCRQAGTRAMMRPAYREAVERFEQALAALAQLPETRDTLEQAIDLRFDLRNALLPLGELARLLDHLQTAETVAELLGDNQRLGRIACYLCIYFSAMGGHERAMAAGHRALAMATVSGAFDVQIVAQTYLGLIYGEVGDFRQALDVSQRVIESLTGERRYARFGQVAPPAVMSRYHAAWSLAELGRFAEGSGVAEEAARLAEAVGHPNSIGSALRGVGLLYRRQGDVHKAIPMLEGSLALSQHALLFLPVTASLLGAAYALAGRAAEALPLLDQTMERVAAGSAMLAHALVLTELSEALLLVGRVDEANTLAVRLLEISRTHTGRGYEAHAYRLLGEVAMRRAPPDVDEAAAHYRPALALAGEFGMRPLVAHSHLGLGKLYRRTGKREQAQGHLTTARTMYREMGMTFWLERAESEIRELG
jgi:tetratricopeptide (TPR) repeat protein